MFFTKTIAAAVRISAAALFLAGLVLAGNCASAQMNVSVSGNKILVNGTPGTLKGFTFIGRLDPTSCGSDFFKDAWKSWSSAELNAAKTIYHANIIRIQVNEDLLYDSTGKLDPALVSGYPVDVANAVALVRSLGMAVDVSMQWEQGLSGKNICDSAGHTGFPLKGVPDANTDKAWKTLLTSAAWTNNTMGKAPQNFSKDSGVLLELVNEPTLGTLAGTPADWATWQSNLQARANYVRSLGSTNVLIIPGEKNEQILDSTALGGSSVASYLLKDPLKSMIYAVHPYFEVKSCCSNAYHVGELSPQDWSRWWGNMASTIPAPVMITEWFAGGKKADKCWDKDHQPSPTPMGETTNSFYTPTMVAQLMSWLATAGPGKSAMSLTGVWPFDSPGFIAQDLNGFTPTFFDSNFSCGKRVQGAAGLTYEGPGQLIQEYFAKH